MLKTTHGGLGVLLIGIALNVGLFRLWCGRATHRPFWVSFEVSGGAMVLIYVGCLWTEPLAGWLSGGDADLRMEWPLFCAELIHSYSPLQIAYWIEFQANSAFQSHSSDWYSLALMLEATFGLPMLLLASIGGLVGQRVAIQIT